VRLASGCNTALPCQIFSESATNDEVEVIVVLLSLTRVEEALIVAEADTIIDASRTLSNIVVVTVSPATREPDSLTRVESADTVELTLHIRDASRTLCPTETITVSPAESEPDSLTLVESATNDAELVVDAIPPRVAKPNACIVALAVGVPEPNLTLLQIAAMVAVAVSEASATTTVTALDVSEATAVTVALLSPTT